MRFDPEYVSQVLNENFKDAKALFLSAADRHPLRPPGHARRAAASSRRDHARALRDALDSISVTAIRADAVRRHLRGLFFHVERLLVEACGEDVAGRLHTARSRNDIDMTMYRMRQREFIVRADRCSRRPASGARSTSPAGTARRCFAAHTHTQPAQPTTIAHYLLAVIEQLERDAVRLRAAYAVDESLPAGRRAPSQVPVFRSIGS